MFIAAHNLMGGITILNTEDVLYIGAQNDPTLGRYAVVHLISNPEAKVCLGCEPEDINIDALNGEED